MATVTQYVDKERGESVVSRQLKRRDGATPANFAKADLDMLLPYLIMALTLHVPDKVKATEFEQRLRALT
jgi:hypothetical protein